MRALLSAALLIAPRAASACAVCFGAADGKEGLFAGFWWAIILLLTVTMSLLGGIGYAVWSIERERAQRGQA